MCVCLLKIVEVKKIERERKWRENGGRGESVEMNGKSTCEMGVRQEGEK